MGTIIVAGGSGNGRSDGGVMGISIGEQFRTGGAKQRQELQSTRITLSPLNKRAVPVQIGLRRDRPVQDK